MPVFTMRERCVCGGEWEVGSEYALLPEDSGFRAWRVRHARCLEVFLGEELEPEEPATDQPDRDFRGERARP